MRPLPLTPFEEYLYHESRRHYPCNIWIRARFTGKLLPEKLSEAIDIAVSRHPLLTARIERGTLGRLCWRFDPEAPAVVHWTQADPDSALPALRHFDPSKETSFELSVTHDGNRWDLVINQSHALCDGAGSFRFLHDLLVEYETLCGGAAEELPLIEPAKLRDRGKRRFHAQSALKTPSAQDRWLHGVDIIAAT